MRARLRQFLRLAVLSAYPAGMTPDASANFGKEALHSNANAYSENLVTIATSGTSVTPTAAQWARGDIRLTTGASGGFTLNLPTTAALIAALGGPNVLPIDGSFSKRITIINDGTGQTGTLTVGDASTTITGTATIATNTVREFALTITGANAVSIQNMGSKTL